MSPRTTIVPVLLTLTSALAAADPSAQQQYRLKPGARGATCLVCHVTFEDTMKLPSVHTPVRVGDCSDCHNPHSSSHADLLAEDAQEICFRCHADIVPAQTRSAHPAALGGDCVACHDPHAAKNPNNLRLSGNALCASCHADIATAAAASKFKHSPVEDSCLNCHGPHAAADSDFLLSSPVPELCENCHDSNGASFVSQHMGYPVGEARCTSCHDPHGSDVGGILWSNVHAPVVNKMCKQCHNDPSAPDALQTKNEKMELCRGCHSQMLNETLAHNRVHGPLVDEVSCLNCHVPHASPEHALLKDSTVTLCGSCHEDTVRRQEMSLTKHAPIEQGECASCHSPHSSDAVFLLADANVIELCGTCHDWQAHSSHPIGPETIDPRNSNLTLDCLSCHRTHGSPFKYFSHADPRMDLCVLCHEEFRR